LTRHIGLINGQIDRFNSVGYSCLLRSIRRCIVGIHIPTDFWREKVK
jgi:hypothetical protein